MLAPEQDEIDRRPVWDQLQMFWMDTDPGIFLESVAKTCAQSKYSLSEIEQIFWNEVRPAVEFNLDLIVGEWTGFYLDWLVGRILETHRFGQPLPVPGSDPYSDYWWQRLRTVVEVIKKTL